MTGPIDGYMLHNRDPRNIMVDIIHNTHEGYRPAVDGSTIRERLELREFLDRVVRTEYMDKRGHDYRQKVEEEMFQILRTLTHASHEAAERLGRDLNHRYSNLIRRGKLVMAEHTVMVREQSWNDPAVIKHMHRQGFVATESLGNKERVITQSDGSLKIAQNPMTPDECFRVSDEEVYYVIS